VLPQLNTALTTPGSWSAQLPPGTEQAVTLRGLPPADTDIIVHPMGQLTVRQKVVPLDIPVTKIGNSAPSDGSQFSIAGVTLGGSPATISSVPDLFAPGQFQQLSDSDQISDPAFQEFDCGVQIGNSSVQGGDDAPRTVTMQWRYIPDLEHASVLDRFEALSPELLSACAQFGAGARSLVKNTGLARFVTPATTSILAVGQASYVITSTDDLSVRADIVPAAGASHAAASAALASYLAANPAESGSLQVMLACELPEGQAA
jgi:hypothetical protein